MQAHTKKKRAMLRRLSVAGDDKQAGLFGF